MLRAQSAGQVWEKPIRPPLLGEILLASELVEETHKHAIADFGAETSGFRDCSTPRFVDSGSHVTDWFRGLHSKQLQPK